MRQSIFSILRVCGEAERERMICEIETMRKKLRWLSGPIAVYLGSVNLDEADPKLIAWFDQISETLEEVDALLAEHHQSLLDMGCTVEWRWAA